MRVPAAILGFTLILCACGGGSTVTLAPAAPAGRLASGASGDPWVFLDMELFLSYGSGNGYVLAYAPAAYYGKPIAITKGLHNPQKLATDSRNDLFVLDYPAPSSSSYKSLSSVRILASPYTGTPRTLRVKGALSLGLDGSNDLFLMKSDEIVELKPPYRNVAIKFSVPSGSVGFALDTHGDVFVSTGARVSEYSPPSYARRAAISIPNCNVSRLAVNSAARLFVVTSCGKTGYWLTDYTTAGGRLQPAHAPVNICDFYYGSMAVSSTGEVFVATACGVLEVTPLFTTMTKLPAFGSRTGVLAVSDGGRLFDGDSISGDNAALLIGSPPYGALQQTVPVAQYDSISSMALGH